MSSRDPFNKVLRELGLYQLIQGMDPIPTAAMLAQQNNTLEVPCRIQVKDLAGNSIPISNIPIEVRGQLTLQLIKFIHPTPETATRIRPMSLILFSNGTVQAVPVHMVNTRDRPGAYPARYRLPASMINYLPLQEQVWRAEKFALGTLLYEVLAGHRIFEGESDEQIQNNYKSAAFPELDELPILAHSLIYACWSAVFGDYIALGKFRRYVHDNPIRFGLQATFAVVSTAAIITVPVLGVIGFSAIGPVAGSAAAGWQASIGLVEAGSLFALCQSAAMGGAAATGLAATGVTGGALAIAATELPNMRSLRETFIRKFRKRTKSG